MDREKVMAGLTMLVDRRNDDTCEELKCCKIAEDALELLKEQQNQIWEFQDQVEYLTDKLKDQDAVEPFHKCIGNEFSLVEDSHFDYCPYCGKPITWARKTGRSANGNV